MEISILCGFIRAYWISCFNLTELYIYLNYSYTHVIPIMKNVDIDTYTFYLMIEIYEL